MKQVDFFSHLWDILSFAEVTVDAPQVLGIMGAFDPHVHNPNQQCLPGSHGEVNRADSDTGQRIQSMGELLTNGSTTSFPTSED